jgi:hypothetical protein
MSRTPRILDQVRLNHCCGEVAVNGTKRVVVKLWDPEDHWDCIGELNVLDRTKWDQLLTGVPEPTQPEARRVLNELAKLVQSDREREPENSETHPPATDATAQPGPTEAEIADLWASCKSLARETDILGAAIAQVRQLGVAGVDPTVGTLILVGVSVRFRRPTSVVVKGPSSGGKSYVVERTTRLFPPEWLYEVTSMSERALIYDQEPLAHRIMVFYEAVGIHGPVGSYIIRSLLSEGRVRYKTTIETEDGTRAVQTVDREGPTGLITTTTLPALHAENETRLLTLTVPDDKEQTRRILEAIADEADEEPDLSRWHSFFRWLATSEQRVIVPFAKALAQLIPPVAVRLRRDFTALLQLIKASALLHRATRQTDAGGRIIATMADYESVRRHVGGVFAQGVEATVPPHVRETVEAAGALLKGQPVSTTLTNAALAAKLRIDKSTALRRVRVAVDKGFLQNLESAKGRPAKIALGDPMPDDEDLLPDLTALEGRWSCLQRRTQPNSATPNTHQDTALADSVARLRGLQGGEYTDENDEPSRGDAWEPPVTEAST